MAIKQLSIFVENKPGRLAEITDLIGNAGVDIRALSIADSSEFGILRLIVNDPRKACLVLSEKDIVVTPTDVIAIGIPDAPGGFAKEVRILSDNGIGIEYAYAFIGRKQNDAYVIIRVNEPEKAVEILKNNGVTILCEEDIYNI